MDLSIALIVNEKQQKEVFDLLPNFEIYNPDNNYKYPLIICSRDKTITRLTGITACSILSQSGKIIRDYDYGKSRILEYLEHENIDNPNV